MLVLWDTSCMMLSFSLVWSAFGASHQDLTVLTVGLKHACFARFSA